MTLPILLQGVASLSGAMAWHILKYGVQSHAYRYLQDMVGKSGDYKAKPRDDWRGYSETPCAFNYASSTSSY